MKIIYFPDTDTALVEISDKDGSETRAIGENICIDLDSSGNLVSMTIEHARESARMPEITYQQVEDHER